MDESPAFLDADGRPVTFAMPDLKDLGLDELVETYRQAMTMVRDRPSADGGGWVLKDRPGAHLDGLQVLAELERQVETLKAAHAFLAVAGGASWTQVGQRLGVTKQAAQQRYGRNARGVTPEEIASGSGQGDPGQAAIAILEQDHAQIAAFLAQKDPAWTAAVLARMGPVRGAHFLDRMDPALAAAAFDRMDTQWVADAFGGLGPELGGAIMERMDPDKTAVVLDRMGTRPGRRW